MTQPPTGSNVGSTNVGSTGTNVGSTGSHHVGTTDNHNVGTTDERSLGQIVSDVSNDFATLMKQEVELAKVELKQEFTKAGTGAGMLGGAGFSGYFVLLFLSVALMFLLDNWLPVEVSALIVALLWAVAAAILATMGRKKLKEANPELPKTQQTLKEDAQWVKAQKN